jgi:hypothetical protein
MVFVYFWSYLWHLLCTAHFHSGQRSVWSVILKNTHLHFFCACIAICGGFCFTLLVNIDTLYSPHLTGVSQEIPLCNVWELFKWKPFTCLAPTRKCCEDGKMIPVVAKESLCREHPWAGAVMRYLPQCPWGPFLMVSVSSLTPTPT